MAQEVYPTVTKTVNETIVTFNFIKKDSEGNLSETDTETRLVSNRFTKLKAQAELQKEFPDEVVNIVSFVTERARYTMDSNDFMKQAKREVIEQ